ncbi:MAG: hypothetical protein D6731_16580 [Planctomycetota bacterium]|nr:MAG: hypothetical protein D6731_16580 [Planctomycetota bacterium]
MKRCAATVWLVLGCGLFFLGCSGSSGGGAPAGGGGSASPAPPATIEVDASAKVGALEPLWRDHYDLSYTLLGYASEPGLPALIDELQPRSWRCSVGRWEVTTGVPGGDSLDPAVLRAVEREYYRGPNTLAGADDPANYDFAYLDRQLDELLARGAEPYLCFDYMPFVLSSEQDPLNPNNIGRTQPQFSFSNGIRTAPPANEAVYARVVRNVIRHVRGRFAGARDFGIDYFEIGNEPDLNVPLFWTGTRAQFASMYAAIAAEVSADPSLAGIKLGAGSFALLDGEPAPTFFESFLDDVVAGGRRLDFVSYHSYGDDPAHHVAKLGFVAGLLGAKGLSPEIVNAEWGRKLDGIDPVYDEIEHGLFRAKVLAAMQDFGVRFAHEAVLRDPLPGNGILGLLFTGPAAHKPASRVYQGLQRLNGATERLRVTAPAGTTVLAGADPIGQRVVVALVVEHPIAPADVDLAVRNFPWGSGYTLDRWEVTESGGVRHVVAGQRGQGELRFTGRFSPDGAGRLVVWELRP